MSKLNLVKPQGVILTIAGKDYSLVYDFNAFAELEKEFGDVQSAFEKLAGTPKFSDIMKIVRAGMASNEVVVSDKELGSHLTTKNLPQVLEKVNEALSQAMPQQDGKATQNQKN